MVHAGKRCMNVTQSGVQPKHPDILFSLLFLPLESRLKKMIFISTAFWEMQFKSQ